MDIILYHIFPFLFIPEPSTLDHLFANRLTILSDLSISHKIIFNFNFYPFPSISYVYNSSIMSLVFWTQLVLKTKSGTPLIPRNIWNWINIFKLFLYSTFKFWGLYNFITWQKIDLSDYKTPQLYFCSN